MRPAEYWRNNKGLHHITPPGERFPEIGLFEALRSAVRGKVFELGCGDGRLSPAFDAYIGMDINPAALEAARRNNPGHEYTDEWTDADTILAYTVLLHVPDDEIQAVIHRMKQYPRMVIGEIMGRKWRRAGNPPVFNREIEDYDSMMGLESERIEVPYPRYSCNLHLLVYDNV